jgi:hypothetical protein
MSNVPRASLWGALQNRQFALLWSGQGLSRVGDLAYQVALALWVLDETGSAAAVSGVVAATVVPTLLFSLFGGAVVDRLPRLAVMYTTDIVRGVIAGGLAVAAGVDVLQPWHVFIASAVFGVAQAFFQPAYAALVPQIAATSSLQSANSLTALSQQGAAVAGPAIGALSYALGGAALGFWLNAVSFGLSALTLAMLDWASLRPGSEAKDSIVSDIASGVGLVMREPWIWFSLLLAGIANLTLTGPMRVAVPYLLHEERDAGDYAYGVLLAAGALGSAITAFVLGHRGKLRKRGIVGYLAWTANGVMLIVFASGLPVPGLWVAALAGGACLTLFELVWVGSLQDLVPREFLGRVWSIDYVVSYGLLPVGVLLIGPATNAAGAAEVLLICGIVTVAIPLLGLFHPAIRGLD